jgi:nucleotide-binding universal stress UspA family protein
VPFGSSQVEQRQLDVANDIVTGLQTLARDRHVRASPLVVNGADPESVILDVARNRDIGLIILGTSVRAGAGRLFLGPRVERILENAPCAVLVYNAPG